MLRDTGWSVPLGLAAPSVIDAAWLRGSDLPRGGCVVKNGPDRRNAPHGVGGFRALVAREPVPDARLVGTARQLHGVCRVAARIVPAHAVALSLMTDSGPTGIVAALDHTSHAVEELQFVLGEGPCWEAFQTRAPVLVPDVRGQATRRWPAYCPAVEAYGFRSAFAFPLRVGSAPLGVLDVYREQPGELGDVAFADSLALASLAAETLLEGQGAAPGDGAPSGVERALESGFPVYQAQGMVMVQLGVPLGEAMARLRAYAFAHERTLESVARDIVARELKFEADER